jgi:hypothetical protein
MIFHRANGDHEWDVALDSVFNLIVNMLISCIIFPSFPSIASVCQTLLQ